MRISYEDNVMARLVAILSAIEDGTRRDEAINEYFHAIHVEKKGIEEGESVPQAFLRLSGIAEEELEEGLILPEIRKLNPEEYKANPYYKLLMEIEPFSVGEITFRTRKYEPRELFLSGEKLFDEDYGDVSPLGYFEEEFPFPCLDQKGRTWMSLIPHEMATMEYPIQNAFGRVLVLGLGLGYFPYMISEKDDVTSIDIIESDPTIIEIFRDRFLPLFPHKEKINIIEADAISYAKDNSKDYAYCFADLWHDGDDGLPIYGRLLNVMNCPADYWIEDSILAYFRRYLCATVIEQLEGATEKDFQKAKTEEDRIINAVYSHFMTTAILKESDPQSVFHFSKLKEAVKAIF